MNRSFVLLYLANFRLKGIFTLISSIFILQIAHSQINDQYLWKNRVLLLFAPQSEHPAFRQQLSILTQDLAEVTDRDLVFYKIFLEGGSTPDHKTISKAESLAFYKKYVVEKEAFTIILIGKDGTEKLRSNKVVSSEILFGCIDQMPMRQREIRQKGH